MESFLGFAYVFFQFLFNNINGESGHCFDASNYLARETGLGARKFWGSKTLNVEHCMKLCVRQKQCKSINYDLESRMCELNKNFRNGKQRTSDTNVYSEYRSWPLEVDRHCYNRPCKDNEVCIPKSLLITSADPDCSYSCMQFSRPVCPLPKMGTSNGRTVGAVNTVKCPKGTSGGGNATCKPDLTWDKEIEKCVGFRFEIKTSEEKYVSAFLETNHDGTWKYVSKDNWYWKNTQVACRDLLGLEYGGSIRRHYKPQSNIVDVDIRCNGNEETLAECDYRGTKDRGNLMVILYCFKYNISAGSPYENITLSPALPSETQRPPEEDTKDFLWVKIEHTWFPVGNQCKNGGKWGKIKTKVACRSMFPHAPNQMLSDLKDNLTMENPDEYMIFNCQGDEPHLFNCQHRICDTDRMRIKLQCN